MEEAMIMTVLMEEGEPNCPFCGSRDFEEIEENKVLCKVCGRVFKKE